MGELRNAGSNHYYESGTLMADFPERFDYVKALWENELIQFSIRPFLKKLLQKKLLDQSRFRILELGSGIGLGYELLSKIKDNTQLLDLNQKYLLPEDMIELYLGLETDGEAVEHANNYYRHKKKVRFLKNDFSEGLGAFKEVEAPFDIYFSKYGRLSLLSIAELRSLVCDMARHAQDGSLLVLDLKGKESVLNSYLIAETKHCSWTGDEINSFIHSIEEETEVSLEILKKTDRSILVASPEENRQYGNLFKHIRQSVNSLLEFNTRTDLNKLILKPEIFPESSRQRVYTFFKEMVFCWNLMIKYTRRRLEKEINPYDLKGWESFPQTLQFGLLTTHRLVKDTEWIMYGDVRANVIEPHLAYVLRSLEFELQKGLGCGQDISTIIRVKK